MDTTVAPKGPSAASAEQRLKELGVTLPVPPQPFGTYVEAVRTDNLLFLTGMLPTHSLEHTGGYTPEDAKGAAGILLPDILPYDPSKPASYPSNGRTLTDDAIDVFLPILANGKVTRDNVGPHTDLLASFPYVGAPHKAGSTERVGA